MKSRTEDELTLNQKAVGSSPTAPTILRISYLQAKSCVSNFNNASPFETPVLYFKRVMGADDQLTRISC